MTGIAASSKIHSGAVPGHFWRIRHGQIGLALVLIAWPLNWTLPGIRTTFLFFPLWLGFVLTVDALVLARRGSSLLSRSRRDFIGLFLLSAPSWWLFEVINWRTQNWEYLGRNLFTDVQYFFLASIAFSTVMPAVFECAELVRSFRFVERFAEKARIQPTRGVCAGCLLAGVMMLTLTLLWPRYFYPFVWGALVLILEPLNVWLGRQSLFDYLAAGDWRPIVSLGLGALLCGVFWEMWNFYSFPKWIYHTPGAEFLYVFEMPLLGFIGYLPFALELFGLKSLFTPKREILHI